MDKMMENRKNIATEARELVDLIKKAKTMEATGINATQVYNLKQACLLLQAQPATLRKYINNGKLAASKVGYRYRLLGQYLLEFIERNRVKH